MNASYTLVSAKLVKTAGQYSFYRIYKNYVLPTFGDMTAEQKKILYLSSEASFYRFIVDLIDLSLLIFIGTFSLSIFDIIFE